MSTSMRRSRARALDDAETFRGLILPDRTCERFEFAGSLRRQKPDVGDVDIVAIPKMGEVPAADMFSTPVMKNLLWHRCDELLAAGTFAKHIKETVAGPRPKWGDICRAIEFRGCCYEINLASLDNWGVVLAVRTGPAELSKELVIAIQRYGYRCSGGFYVFDQKCKPPQMVPMPTEERFFGIAGKTCHPPEKR